MVIEVPECPLCLATDWLTSIYEAGGCFPLELHARCNRAPAHYLEGTLIASSPELLCAHTETIISPDYR